MRLGINQNKHLKMDKICNMNFFEIVLKRASRLRIFTRTPKLSWWYSVEGYAKIRVSIELLTDENGNA